ncbi:MAG: hypothetical protein M3022_10770 [Actinomycetota bacterium]|nr:hypothetical protein [Actinomycetota bacterium]
MNGDKLDRLILWMIAIFVWAAAAVWTVGGVLNASGSATQDSVSVAVLVIGKLALGGIDAHGALAELGNGPVSRYA